MDDEILIKEFKRGNEKAFEELVKRYQRRVYYLCYRMVRNYEDSADLTQDVFVRVYKGLKKFRFKSSLWTWIYRITLNLCISFSKSRKKELLQNSIFPHSPTPQENYKRKELRKAIDRAILSLPSQQRAVFIMHYYEDMKYKDIAEVIGCKLGTVKVHYFQAIRKLREFLKEWI